MAKLIHRTIGDCLRLRGDLTPDRIGISSRDQDFSWKEIDTATDSLAIAYLYAGIARGNRVAIWGVNSPAWVLCFFALQKIGAIPVPVNTCYKKQELELLLRQMEIQYLFYGNGIREISYPEVLKTVALETLPHFQRMFPLDYPAAPMKHGDRQLLCETKRRVDVMDTACILPTSGTTSTSKGVKLSHYSLVNNAQEISRQMIWTQEDRFCISVPLFHCFGITAGILAGVMTGARLQLLKYYKTLDVLEQVERYRCTVVNGVPTMFLAMSRNEKRGMFDLSSIKSGIIAGSPLTKKEYEEICLTLGVEKLQLSYGQTEASPCISISSYRDSFKKKTEMAGKVIPNIEVRIDPATGEILTRGYHVMQGYYNMEEETRRTIDRDGWLHTGDRGELDEKGYLTVTGRMKDMIIRGGENIAPLEIESCIQLIPGVQSVKVIGIRADVLQEEIAACVILQAGSHVTKEQVQMQVKRHLANYKVPRYVLEFSEFPMGESGKVMIRELRLQVEEQIKGRQ